jgi:hypothetical protein
MRLTLTAGIFTWTDVSSVPDLPASIGRVVTNVASGPAAPTNFTVNVIFEADIPTDGATGFIPINTIRVGGGLSVSSFTGAFYCVP